MTDETNDSVYTVVDEADTSNRGMTQTAEEIRELFPPVRKETVTLLPITQELPEDEDGSN